MAQVLVTLANLSWAGFGRKDWGTSGDLVERVDHVAAEMGGGALGVCVVAPKGPEERWEGLVSTGQYMGTELTHWRSLR